MAPTATSVRMAVALAVPEGDVREPLVSALGAVRLVIRDHSVMVSEYW